MIVFSFVPKNSSNNSWHRNSSIYKDMVEFCAKNQITIHEVPEEYKIMDYVSKDIEEKFWTQYNDIVFLFPFDWIQSNQEVDCYMRHIYTMFEYTDVFKEKTFLSIVLSTSEMPQQGINNTLYPPYRFWVKHMMSMRYIEPIVVRRNQNSNEDLKRAIAAAMVKLNNYK